MKRFYLLLVLLVGLNGLVFLLWHISQQPSITGFMRLFPPHKVGLTGVGSMAPNSYYLSGINDSTLYLGMWSDPDHVVKLHYHHPLDTASPVVMTLNRDSSIAISVGTRQLVYFPHFFQMDFIWNKVIVHSTASQHASVYSLPTGSMSKIMPLSPYSYVIAIYDTILGTNNLQKIIFPDTHSQVHRVTLPKQIDGMFCTQGNLSYDRTSHRIFYSYLYSNTFIALDTTLQVCYFGKTIDPIERANFTIDTVKTGDISKVTFGSPPMRVNNMAFASSPYYYVHSLIRSEEESSPTWDQYSVIDVYQQVDGKYLYSFYVLNYKGIPLTDFVVYRRTLITLNGSYILRYTLFP